MAVEERSAIVAAPPPQARRRRVSGGPASRVVEPVLGILAFLVLVEIARALLEPVRSGIPSMFAAVTELGQQLFSPAFWGAVGNTLLAWGAGLGLAVVIAVPLAILVGMSSAVYTATSMTAEVLRPVPPVAVIPLAVLLLGSGVALATLLAFIGAFWPVYLQTTYGVRSVDSVMLRTAQVYGFNRREQVLHVVLPASAPFVATGLRLSAAAALILAVTGGIVTGSPGLGARITELQSGGAVVEMYAVVIATGLIGVLINRIFHLLEAPTLHWHPSRRRENP